VRNLGLGYAAGPSLVKEGIKVAGTVGWKAVGARLLKSTGEELAESQMTGRPFDPVNVALDATTQILDEAYTAIKYGYPNGLQPDDEVMQFQSNRAEPGVEPVFNNKPRSGEPALSGQLGSDPIQGIRNAFDRASRPNEFYRITTVKQLCVNGAYPVYDAGTFGMPPGHVSMYTNDPIRFAKAWSKPLPIIQ
jgi:hypothetical protein